MKLRIKAQVKVKAASEARKKSFNWLRKLARHICNEAALGGSLTPVFNGSYERGTLWVTTFRFQAKRNFDINEVYIAFNSASISEIDEVCVYAKTDIDKDIIMDFGGIGLDVGESNDRFWTKVSEISGFSELLQDAIFDTKPVAGTKTSVVEKAMKPRIKAQVNLLDSTLTAKILAAGWAINDSITSDRKGVVFLEDPRDVIGGLSNWYDYMEGSSMLEVSNSRIRLVAEEGHWKAYRPLQKLIKEVNGNPFEFDYAIALQLFQTANDLWMKSQIEEG